MKQFNLKEYLANPARKVVTRDGRLVRIICTDMKSYNEKIVGLIPSDTGIESIVTWTQQGKFFSNADTPNDLFFAPEKHEGWVNLYKCTNKDCAYYMGSIFNSKAEAENKRDTSDNYVATIKFEWEE